MDARIHQVGLSTSQNNAPLVVPKPNTCRLIWNLPYIPALSCVAKQFLVTRKAITERQNGIIEIFRIFFSSAVSHLINTCLDILRMTHPLGTVLFHSFKVVLAALKALSVFGYFFCHPCTRTFAAKKQIAYVIVAVTVQMRP